MRWIPFDAADARGQSGAEEASIGGLVRDPADGRCSYFGDTRRFGPCTRTNPGVVPKTITSSPLGATNKPNDTPSATVYVPEQSGLTV
jgi:hypothetical protein